MLIDSGLVFLHKLLADPKVLLRTCLTRYCGKSGHSALWYLRIRVVRFIIHRFLFTPLHHHLNFCACSTDGCCFFEGMEMSQVGWWGHVRDVKAVPFHSDGLGDLAVAGSCAMRKPS